MLDNSIRPDIIVNAPGRSPVVVETEYLPARTVEPKAKSRLGLKVGANGRIIEAAIALRYPDTVSVKGGVILGHGVSMVSKCPAKWPAKMSLVLLAMITDGSYSTRSRFMGGLRASMYFFAVSRWMPSSRATPRVDNPLRFAF